MRSVDWHLLEYFRLVGRHQHVGRAAAELGTSQPALSRAIARLEGRIGVKLFERAGRAIRLSEQGRVLLAVVERAYGEIDETQAAVSADRATVPKAVGLGFIRTLGVELVPQVVRQFTATQPDVHFTFFASNAPTIEDHLEHGDLDLLFTALPPNRGGLAWEKVVDQELIIIAPRNSPLTRRRFVRVQDLADTPFVTFKRGHMIRGITDSLCNVAGFLPKITFEADDSSVIPGFVAAGFGVAMVPSDGSLPPSVVVLPTRQPLMLRPMGLAWVEGRFMHANARAFREFVLCNKAQVTAEFLAGRHARARRTGALTP